MNRIEEIQAEVVQLGFKLEALGWRLAAHARELALARERLDRELGRVPTQPLLLRPPVKVRNPV